MDTFFLACLGFGALFTLASLVLGSAHVGHLHIGPGHHGHAAGHHGHAAGHHGHAAGYHGHAAGHHLPAINVSSVLAAITWFGAAGYVLSQLGDWAMPAVILGALLAGAIGWYLIARFLGVVLAGQTKLDPADYRLEGTVGEVTVRIPPGGTGEVVFSKVGLRRSEAARGLQGAAIPRGTEVVITQYADGFATVQPWSEYIQAHDRVTAERQAQQQRGSSEA
jgi:membrane protein implicated in regulation of membrane protease activity